MEFLSGLGVEVVKWTGRRFERQFGYVYDYRGNIRRLKASVEFVQAKTEEVDNLVRAAPDNEGKIMRMVFMWKRRVECVTKRVDRLLEQGRLCEEEGGCSYIRNLWLRLQISRTAKEISAEIDELMSLFPACLSCQKLLRCLGLPSVQIEEFPSRISAMDEIMEALADPAVHMVGLYGLSGVGKTTLTKQVAVKAKVEMLFETVVWVEVKHNSIKEIQSRIADQVELQFAMQSESEIVTANRLCERMEKEKSLLVILDDIWKRFDLKQAGIPFPDEGNNHCKIILTSRNEDVLTSQMNCTRNIKVELLSEMEAQQLFYKASAIYLSSNFPDLLPIADEVVPKCAQLPIAIVAVARALRNNNNSTKWNDALIQLKRHTSQNIPGVKDEVYCSIKLSYDYLESQELKSIFLLSANLSHEPLISEIFMYSVGLDLLEGVQYLNEARVRLYTRVQQLKASSLLLSSYSKDRFRMHDIVRDVALFIAYEEKHALVKRYEKVGEWPDNDQLESCTAICLDNSDIDEIPEELYGPKVEFFLLNATDPDLRIPSNFFRGMKKLKVLKLANMAFSSLPFSISLLEKLRTLSLHSCTLEDITIVKHLRRLKILNLSYSRIEQLPCEVAQLSRIQMLNLSCCSELEVIPPNILSNLKELEELYMEKSFNQWDAQGKERASLAELQHLQKLSILEINIPDASVLPKDLFLENSLEMYKISIGTSRVHFSDYECPRKLTLKLDNNIDKEYGVSKLLDSVEDLYLENLNGITSLCQVVRSPGTLRKLTAIQVRCCHQLKFLFSDIMVRTLFNLEKIEVFECKSIEQIVAFESKWNVKKSDKGVAKFPRLYNLTLTSLPLLTSFCFNEKVVFPSLAILRLESINVLNIWQIPTSTSSGTKIPDIVHQFGDYCTFQDLIVLKVEMCDFILKLIPLPLLKSLSSLQELWISSCLSLEVVFDFEELNNYTETRSFGLKILDVRKLPKLKTVWGKDSQKNFSFQNLQKITASECESLESIFPASVAKDLVRLEELEIKSCGIEVLVAKDESMLEVDASFEFPKLTSIKLLDLPYLKNFYSQSHTSGWPLLQKLEIKDCNELEIFQPEFPDSLHIKYPLFSDEKVIPKLEVLTLDGRHATMIWNGKCREYHFPHVKALYLSRISMAATFPYGLFYGFPNLEYLEVSYSSFEVIFSDSRHLHDAQNVAPFKKLRLYLLQPKHIWNEKCQLDLVLHNLQSLEVFSCPRLLNLGPSFVSLENLVDLEVNDCDRLINLFTCQTARTLIQLTRLIIKRCNNIREIITNGGEDLEKEIVFTNLKSMELFELPNCESFCRHSYSFMFPSLAEVTIRSCPRLRMFCPGVLTTPFFRGVKVENNEILWQSDLNKTIEQLFAEKVAFRSTNLKLHEYPELIDIWKGKLPILDRSFCNLASLVMEKCDFLSNHVIPSYVLRSLINLKSLKVSSCDFVEVVFDLEGINIEEEAHKLQAIHLAKLTLDHLPNLKHVWNKDAHRIDCFQNLEYVHAYECETLRSIFPASIAKGLTKLKKLEIESCGVEVIVAEDQTPEETINFVFPQLCFLGLIKLPNLKNFHPQRHTIEWPQLKTIDVRLCNNLKVFGLEDPNIREMHAKDDGVENQYPLFLLDKVVTKFESLVLNQNDVRILRNGPFQDDLFQEVWFLGLDSFDDDEEPLVFPYAFLERFPNLSELTVGNGSFC